MASGTKRNGPRLLFVHANTCRDPMVPPYGLQLLEATVASDAVRTRVFDPNVPGSPPVSDVVAGEQPDLVCASIRNVDSCMSLQWDGQKQRNGINARFFLDELSALFAELRAAMRPSALLVLGGSGFSVLPQYCLERFAGDIGVVGPGEVALRAIVQAFRTGRDVRGVPGVVVPGSRRVKPPLRSYPDAGDAPVARPIEYRYTDRHFGVPIRCKIGCTRTCSYCVVPAIEGRRCLERSPEGIVREMSESIRAEPWRDLFFLAGSEINVPDERHAIAICKHLVSSGMSKRTRWVCYANPAPFSRDLARLMKRAHCVAVSFTIDSASDRVLASAGKPHGNATALDALRLCRSVGLPARGRMLFGLPGENSESIEQSCTFVERHSWVDFGAYDVGARVYPTTPLERSVQDSLMADHLYGKRDARYVQPVFYCSPCSPAELHALLSDRFTAVPNIMSPLSQRYRRAQEIHRVGDRLAAGAASGNQQELINGFADAVQHAFPRAEFDELLCSFGRRRTRGRRRPPPHRPTKTQAMAER
jgi:hypothetical protein